MNWEEFRETFYKAASNVDTQLEYVMKIVTKFEELIAMMQVRDPGECIDSIAHNMEIANQIFQLENKDEIPAEAVETATQCLAKVQQFLAVYIRLTILLQMMSGKQAHELEALGKIPLGTTWH